MVNNSLNYKNFQLQHQFKNRVRVITPVLINDPERGYLLEILLKKRTEIRKVRSVFAIGSVAIDFDSKRLSKKNLLILLDAVLGNIAKKRHTDNVQVKKEFHGPLQEIDLEIEGMSCASCALLIEIVLNHDQRVKAASVNFTSHTLNVHGQISKLEVIEKINSLGYNALLSDTLSQQQTWL